MKTDELSWHQLHWPYLVDPALVIGVLRRWAADEHRRTTVLEATATGEALSYRLGVAARGPLSELATAIPGLRSEPDRSRGLPNRVARVRLQPPDAPLQVTDLTETTRGILAALIAANRADEWATLQIVLGQGLPPRRIGNVPDRNRGIADALLNGTRPAPADVAKQVRLKAASGRFVVDIRIGIRSEGDVRQAALVRGVLASLRTLQSSTSRISLTRDQVARFVDPPRPGWRSSTFTTEEVLQLLALPTSSPLPGTPSGHPRLLPLAKAVDFEGRVFARTSALGQELPLGITAAHALHHTAIIGPTGAGKSTLMMNLIAADLRAGRGLVLIDPNGDLARDVLRVTPPERRDDIVLLDPTSAQPVGFNPLRSPGTAPELVADRIVGIIRGLFPSMFGTRTSDVLHASLLTLMLDPSTTLSDLPRLLSNDSYRASLLRRLGPDDDALAEFWASYVAMSPAQQAQFAGPVLSRLRQFLLRPQLRRILEQPEPRFDLRQVFTNRAVLIVPLNTGLIGGDAARLIGSLLVAQLWQLTLSRAALPKEHRPVVSIYIDEAAEYLRLGGEVGDALARSRGLGVAWHLAFQYRDQFAAEVKTAVDVNTLNKVAFTLTGRDARDLAADTPDLQSEDFTALDRFKIYAQLHGVTGRSTWVSGRTLPAPETQSDPDELIAASQARYGRIDALVARTWSDETPPVAPETPIGRRRRSGS